MSRNLWSRWLLLFAVGYAGAWAQQTHPASTVPAAQTGYVGSEACQTCHGDIYAHFLHAPHQKTLLAGHGPAQQGCEGCHGPGAAHIANPGAPGSIFNYRTATFAAVNQRCLACHTTSHEQVNFARAVHARNRISCTDCHGIHQPATERSLLKAKQPQLCYSCHLQQRAQFDMPSHHKVNEGLVQCTDCHNPHGAPPPTQLRLAAAGDLVCYTCHADKRGPFVYEHPPVKVEGCTACHSPHGSSNPHLLRMSNVNLLCLQCHTTSSISGAPGTPSFHNQSAQYQSCLSCHTQIHGSNFSPVFFQ